MFTTKLKIVAAALVAAGTIAVPGVLAYQGRPGNDQAGRGPASKKSLPPAPQPSAPALALPADDAADVGPAQATPDAALDEMARLSERALQIVEGMVANGTGQYESASNWSRRLVEAKAGRGSPKPVRTVVLRGHLERMEKLLAFAKARKEAARGTELDVLEAEYRVAEAERWVRDGQMTTAVEAKSPIVGDGFVNAFDRKPIPLKIESEAGDLKRNQAIVAKLEEALSMNFGTETPLADVLKYIKDATQDEAAGLMSGIPIYIDPMGLQAADKTEADTIKITLEGIPLRTTLSLILHQLGLTYRVEGGLLLITDEDVIISPAPPKKPPAGFQ